MSKIENMPHLYECPKCETVKHKDDFYKQASRSTGIQGQCKECVKAKEMDKWHAMSPEQKKAVAEKRRNWNLRKKYGITLDEYNAILEAQNHSCEICGIHEDHLPYQPNHGDVTKLVVDHDHDTGDVRGLLCTSCNSGLGMFKDNISFLKKAMEYLGE